MLAPYYRGPHGKEAEIKTERETERHEAKPHQGCAESSQFRIQMIYQYVSPAVKQIFVGRLVNWKHTSDGIWYCLAGKHGVIWAPERECHIQEPLVPQAEGFNEGCNAPHRGAQRDGARVPSP